MGSLKRVLRICLRCYVFVKTGGGFFSFGSTFFRLLGLLSSRMCTLSFRWRVLRPFSFRTIVGTLVRFDVVYVFPKVFNIVVIKKNFIISFIYISIVWYTKSRDLLYVPPLLSLITKFVMTLYYNLCRHTIRLIPPLKIRLFYK